MAFDFKNMWGVNAWGEGNIPYDRWFDGSEAAVDTEGGNSQANLGNKGKEPIIVHNGLQISLTEAGKEGQTVIFFDKNLYWQDGLSNPDSYKVEAILYTENDPFALATKAALNSLWASPTAKLIVQALQKKTSPPFLIKQTDQVGEGSRSVATMCYWNDKNPEVLETENGLEADNAIVLIHELGHAYRYSIGLNDLDANKFVDAENALPKEEEETSHLENIIRADTGRSLRTVYTINIVNNGKRIHGKLKRNYKALKNKVYDPAKE